MTDIDELAKELRTCMSEDLNDKAADAIETLRAELEQVRKDAERFAWTVACEDNAEAVYAMVLNHGPFHLGTIRLEVDAAQQQATGYCADCNNWGGAHADGCQKRPERFFRAG